MWVHMRASEESNDLHLRVLQNWQLCGVRVKFVADLSLSYVGLYAQSEARILRVSPELAVLGQERSRG
jgi:hypothetical protein